MPPMPLFKGVTPRLVAVTAAVVLVFIGLTGILAITRSHFHDSAEQEKSIVNVFTPHLEEIAAVVRREAGRGGGTRSPAFDRICRHIQATLPDLEHLSIVSTGPGHRVLYENGRPLNLAFPESPAGGTRPGFRVLRDGEDSIVLCEMPLPAGLAGVLRAGMTFHTYRAHMAESIRSEAGLFAIILVLSVLASTVMIGVLTRSLRSVASYAHAIENGEFSSEIAVSSHDEASTIAEAFNLVLHRLRDSYVSTLGALAALLETKDRLTETHSLRGVRYAIALGKAAGLSPAQLTQLEYGSLLHDIGKIGVADFVLKKTGPLTEEEWQIMRQHPAIGYNVLKNLEFLHNSLPIVLHHQERYDGRGYPNGLKGEQIPLLARIFTIADAFDAMTSDRPYRKSMRPDAAIQEMKRNSGTQFDPKMTEIFVRLWTDGRLNHIDGHG